MASAPSVVGVAVADGVGLAVSGEEGAVVVVVSVDGVLVGSSSAVPVVQAASRAATTRAAENDRGRERRGMADSGDQPRAGTAVAVAATSRDVTSRKRIGEISCCTRPVQVTSTVSPPGAATVQATS